MGARGRLPVRSGRCDPRDDLLDRHAPADRVGLAAHRPRVLVHAHRPRRPVPAHARPARVLPDGLGRQRPAHRAPRAELLRCALRPHAALRPRLRPALRGRRQQEHEGRRPAADQPTQLHRALRTPHRRGRAAVRGPVPPARPLGGLEAVLPHHRRRGDLHVAAGVRAQRRARRGVPGAGAHALGRDLPHRRGPGRARGPRAGRALPPRDLPPPRRRHARDRDEPPRAHPGVRGPRRAPRRRALPAAVRHDRDDPRVRGRGARRRAPPRPEGQGHRHRDDLHLRRRDRRRVVARARPAQSRHHRLRRTGRGRGARRHHDRGRSRGLRRARRQDDVLGEAGRGRAAPRVGRPARRAEGDHASREVLREGRPPPRDRLDPAVVHRERRARRVPQGHAARAGPRDRLAPRLHARALRELGQRPCGRLAHLPPAVLRRADPGLVPARRRGEPGVRRAHRRHARPAPRRPVVGARRRATTSPSAASPAGSSASTTSWTPGPPRR